MPDTTEVRPFAAAVRLMPAGLLVAGTRAKRFLIAGAAWVFFAALMPATGSMDRS